MPGPLTRKAKGLRTLPAGFAVGVAALMALVLIAVLDNRERAFLVEANTSSIDLRFSGPRNVWFFPEATVCTPRPPDLAGATAPPASDTTSDTANDASPDGTAGAPSDQACDPDFFTIATAAEMTLAWPDGAGARVTRDPDGAVVIEAGLRGLGGRAMGGPATPVRPDALPDGAILVLPAEVWGTQPALTFEAQAAIGREIAPGARHYLHEGRWEARQTAGWLESYRASEVVKEGALSAGAEVSVQQSDGTPVVMFGHLTPGPEDVRGFDVTAISAMGQTELRLVHFGFDQAAVITPDAIDTLASSSILVALALVVTLMAAISQAGADLVLRLFERAGAGDESATPEASSDEGPVARGARARAMRPVAMRRRSGTRRH